MSNHRRPARRLSLVALLRLPSFSPDKSELNEEEVIAMAYIQQSVIEETLPALFAYGSPYASSMVRRTL